MTGAIPLNTAGYQLKPIEFNVLIEISSIILTGGSGTVYIIAPLPSRDKGEVPYIFIA
jgi:hypothetical protein